MGARRTLTGALSGTTPTPDTIDGVIDNRGFTGHEMLDQLDLVHMNGRIYDPLLARFLSADPILQDPMNAQSYNRYSYVMNNPTNLTDPTGFMALQGLEGCSVNSGGCRRLASQQEQQNVQPSQQQLQEQKPNSNQKTDGQGNRTTDSKNSGLANSLTGSLGINASVQEVMDKGVELAPNNVGLRASGAVATGINELVVPDSAGGIAFAVAGGTIIKVAGSAIARAGSSVLGKLKELLGFGKAAKAAWPVDIAVGKFDFLFGRVTSNTHNAARSNQLALEMKRLGVPDTASGHRMLAEHFTLSARTDGNVARVFSDQYGRFEVRESLFIGPSGQAAKFETTFQVLGDGTRRFSTVIPLH